MSARRIRLPVWGVALSAAALVSAACFGGGQPAAQPTSTAGASPSSAAPPISAPVLPSPSPLAASPSPSPTAVRATGPEQNYTVEAGDTLATIAQKFYGDSTLWRKIYDANKPAVGDNPDTIKVGTQLKIPPKD